MSQNPVDKSKFIQSIKGLKWENITIDVSDLGLTEEEYLEMEKMQPGIKFSKVAYRH